MANVRAIAGKAASVVGALQLAACAATGPLSEHERASFRHVAPAPARFAPELKFLRPAQGESGASRGAKAGAAAMAFNCLIIPPPFYFGCLAVFAPVGAASGAVIGSIATPGAPADPATARSSQRLIEANSQEVLLRRFSLGVVRFTSYPIVEAAAGSGPGAPDDTPSYAGLAAPDDTVVAELSVLEIDLVSTTGDTEGATFYAQPLLLTVGARLRLVQPGEGRALMTREYHVSRYLKPLTAYARDSSPLRKALDGAIDEIAMLMVHDAFLLQSGGPSRTGEARIPAVRALAPLPSDSCTSTSFGCWASLRVPEVAKRAPEFRWQALAGPAGSAPYDVVYDLWVFGGSDDRLIDGLRVTEYRFERPFEECTRYSWAVRARVRNGDVLRASPWSSAASLRRDQLEFGEDRPVLGAPFRTDCPDAVQKVYCAVEGKFAWRVPSSCNPYDPRAVCRSAGTRPRNQRMRHH